MSKRKIEVFTAGCALCDDAITEIHAAACPSCEVEERPMREPGNAEAARGLGIRRVPAVVIDGRLADCCATGRVDLARLRELGLGQPAA